LELTGSFIIPCFRRLLLPRSAGPTVSYHLRLAATLVVFLNQRRISAAVAIVLTPLLNAMKTRRALMDETVAADYRA
jgi:hypothetical protein